MTSKLDRIFNAKSIAIVGASNNPGKRGHQAIRQLMQDRYEGRIFPVNPNESEILGLKAYPSILEVQQSIDCALICTPAPTLPEILQHCGSKKIPGVVALSAGFNEIGAVGADIAQKSLDIAKEQGVRIIGPNTNGIFNLHNKMNLVGLADIEPGGIGICSQSGNMMLTFVNEAIRQGLNGFSSFAGVGNQLDVGLEEYLRHFGNDDNTKIILFYIEGFINGRKFLDACREVSPKKPIVIFKSGRSAAGQNAAKSHTGSLASGYKLASSLLRQAGANVIDHTDKVIPVTNGLLNLPSPAGNRIAVVADGGGSATILADALIDAGLELAKLSNDTIEKLQSVLPKTATVNNPVDVADATVLTPSINADCAAILLADENVDILVFTGMYGGFSTRFDSSLLEMEVATSHRLVETANRYGKPFIVHSIYSDINPEPLAVLKQSNIPVFCWAEPTVACIVESVRYANSRRNRLLEESAIKIPSLSSAKKLLEKIIQDKHTNLFEHEAMELLSCYGIETQNYLIARTEKDLVRIPELFGDVPVAMKIASRDILHKSAAGGVKLNVVGKQEFSNCFHAILANARKFSDSCDILGVKVSPMSASGMEVVLGVTQDEAFGPVLMFGAGGVNIEVFEDVAFRSLPVARSELQEMILETDQSKLFDRTFDSPQEVRRKLTELMLKLNQLALAHPAIKEIDLNPVILRNDGMDIVDARMILHSS